MRQSLHVLPRYWYWFRTDCVRVQWSQLRLINFLSYSGPDCICFQIAAKLKCRQVLGTSNRIVPSDKPFRVEKSLFNPPSRPAKSTKNVKNIVIRDKIVMQCFLVHGMNIPLVTWIFFVWHTRLKARICILKNQITHWIFHTEYATRKPCITISNFVRIVVHLWHQFMTFERNICYKGKNAVSHWYRWPTLMLTVLVLDV